MSYGFKSAPASRASSISRQYEEKVHTSHGHQLPSGIRPPSTRPRTLERTRRKSYSSTRTPLSKSKSHSQGNLVKDSNRVKTEEEEEASYKSDYFLNSTKVNLQHHKDYLDCVRRDRVYSEPLSYQQEMSLYTKNHPGSPQASHRVIQPAVHSQENLYEATSGNYAASNNSVETLEADLAELMEQLVEPQQEKDSAPCTNDSLPYSKVTHQKSKPKPKVFSLLRSAPSSLFSSRRSSLDLSGTENGGKRLQKASKKAAY